MRVTNGRDKIVLDLYHDSNPNAGIVVTPELFGSGWVYRVALPDYIERYRVVSLVVQLVMLEITDRNAARSTELPTWLAEGMTRQVMLSSQVELVVEAPRKVENGVTLERTTNSNLRTSMLRDGAWAGLPKLGEAPNNDPLAQTLETLRTIPPLGIGELSWPREGQFEGQAAGTSYRMQRAPLFVNELLHLPERPRRLAAHSCRSLSQHLNWQIAFLQALFWRISAPNLNWRKCGRIGGYATDRARDLVSSLVQRGTAGTGWMRSAQSHRANPLGIQRTPDAWLANDAPSRHARNGTLVSLKMVLPEALRLQLVRSARLAWRPASFTWWMITDGF